MQAVGFMPAAFFSIVSDSENPNAFDLASLAPRTCCIRMRGASESFVSLDQNHAYEGVLHAH